MRRPGLAFLLAFPSLMLAGGSAWALRVVALAPQMKPPTANEIRDRYHEAIVRGLSQGADVVPVADVRMWATGDPQLFQCAESSCATQVASLMKADRVVVSTIEIAGKEYAIKLRAFDARGAEAGQASESCDICTVREAAAATERAAHKLVTQLAAAPKAKPAPVEKEKAKPAVVAPEEEEPRPRVVKPAPAPQPVAPQPKPEAKEREVARAEAPPPSTTPAPAPAEVPPGPPLRALGWVAIAVGAVMIVPTGVFGYYAARGNVYLNQDGTACTAPDKVHSCPRVYDTTSNMAGAIASGAVAGIALTAGAVMLYLDKRHREPHPVTVGAAPIPGGFSASASFEF